jgi:hypothetical protein
MGARVGWFRRRTGWVCALALLALTIQFIASFGHFHREHFIEGGHSVAVADAGDPASTADRHEDDAPCDVCWAVQLLGNAQIVIPPLLPVPVVFTRAATCVPLPNAVTLPDCRAFQSRAPPSA